MLGVRNSSQWLAFWRSVIRFQRDKITPWLALRNTLGVALPLAAGMIFGVAPVGIALATGALNVSYSDSHEPYLLRARKMLAASVLVGAAVFTGAVCGRYQALSVVVAALWAFAAGILVALSPTAGDLGVISLVTLIVYSAVPQTPERALYAGLLALCGGLFQTLLANALWPLRRYVPERRVLGKLYQELARAAAAPTQVKEPPVASASITQARTTLSTLDRDHSVDGERYRTLLSQAERIRLTLLLLGRLRVRLERVNSAGPAWEAYLAKAANILQAIGDALVSGDPAPVYVDLSDAGILNGSKNGSGILKEAQAQMDALSGQLRSAAELASHATPEGLVAYDRLEAARPWRLRLAGTFATLSANFSFSSTAFRHAIRLAVCVALGTSIGLGLHLHRAYWVPMTVAIVLKPDFTGTFSRGLLRLAGTFVGLALATGLFHLSHPSTGAEILQLAAFMFALRCFGSANYGIFVTMVTALVVLLMAIAGVAPKDVIAARAINTVAGGVIALLAYWFWPTWERTQTPELMARMLDSYRLYFRAIRDAYLNPSGSFDLELDRLRLEGRRARSNLEASMDRLCAEPGTPADTVSSLGSLLANSHRLIHAVMALEAGLSGGLPEVRQNAFLTFANDVELTLYYVASSLRGSPIPRDSLPNLREDHKALKDAGELVETETDRITNSLNTLSEQAAVV